MHLFDTIRTYGIEPCLYSSFAAAKNAAYRMGYAKASQGTINHSFIYPVLSTSAIISAATLTNLRGFQF